MSQSICRIGGRARQGAQRRHIVLGVSAAALAVAVAAALPATASAQDMDQSTPPPESQDRGQPIVGGHDLQPRAGQLGKPDVTSKDAKTVDELYEKLIEEERKAGNLPPAGPSSGGSSSKKAPPQNSNQ
jgi:hypothetical protein